MGRLVRYVLLYACLLLFILMVGCSTSFVEFKGECVIQNWQLLGYSVRQRQICDLPPPSMFEEQVRDREPMSVNPFPDLLDFVNEADSIDPNLLEKSMDVPPDEGDER